MASTHTLGGQAARGDHSETFSPEESKECGDFFDAVFDYSNGDAKSEALKEKYARLPEGYRQAALDYLRDSASLELQADVMKSIGLSQSVLTDTKPVLPEMPVAGAPEQNVDLKFPASGISEADNKPDKRAFQEKAAALAEEIKRIRVSDGTILSVQRYARKLPNLIISTLTELSANGGQSEVKTLLQDSDLISRLKEFGGSNIQSNLDALSSGIAPEARPEGHSAPPVTNQPIDGAKASGIVFDRPMSEQIPVSVSPNGSHNGASAELSDAGLASVGNNVTSLAEAVPAVPLPVAAEKGPTLQHDNTVADGINVGIGTEGEAAGGQTVLIDANGAATTVDQAAVEKGAEPNLVASKAEAVAPANPPVGTAIGTSAEVKAVPEAVTVNTSATTQNPKSAEEEGVSTTNNGGTEGAISQSAEVPGQSVNANVVASAEIAGAESNIQNLQGRQQADQLPAGAVSPIAGDQGVALPESGQVLPAEAAAGGQPRSLLGRLFGRHNRKVDTAESAGGVQADAMNFWKTNRQAAASEDEQEQVA